MLDSRVDDNHVRTLNMLKYLKVLFCAALMAVMCGCDVGDAGIGVMGSQGEEVREVVKTLSSWLEPYLYNGGFVQEDDHETIYLRGRVGEVASVFNVIDVVIEVSKEKRSVSFFGLLPTLVPGYSRQNMIELISRGEMAQGLSSAWLVLDDFGHVGCQSRASFDSILQKAEETKSVLVGAVLDKLVMFSPAVAAVEIGCSPIDAMPAIGHNEPFKELLGGRVAGREDDTKYILEKFYNNEVQAVSEDIDPWWKSLSSKECDSKADFIHARMEEVTKDFGGRYDVLPYTLIVRDGMVWSVCVMPDICPIEKRSEVAMELMKINAELSTTLLHMDFETGRIWSCCSLATSALRGEERLPSNDFYEAILKALPVGLIATNSEKISSAFTTDEEN